MSYEQYNSIPGINFSTLKAMAKSPLAYKHALENRREDTPSFAIGRYVHALVFEPESVADHFAVYDSSFVFDYVLWEGGDRRGKAWKEFEAQHEGKTILKPNELAELKASHAKLDRTGPVWAQFAAANEGKTLFTEGEAKPCIAAAEAVRNHPLVRPYLAAADGVFEETLSWVDRDSDMTCKGRLDWHVQSMRALIELKTCRTIGKREFANEIAKYDYHGQLAHYANGLAAAKGWFPRKQVIIAVEKTAPHDVAVFDLDENAKKLARDNVAKLLARVAECRRANEWPGRYTAEECIDVPPWAYGYDDIEISFEGEEDGSAN